MPIEVVAENSAAEPPTKSVSERANEEDFLTSLLKRFLATFVPNESSLLLPLSACSEAELECSSSSSISLSSSLSFSSSVYSPAARCPLFRAEKLSTNNDVRLSFKPRFCMKQFLNFELIAIA